MQFICSRQKDPKSSWQYDPILFYEVITPVLQGRTLNCILTPPDMFAEDVGKDTVGQDDANTDGDYDRQKPLPQGWSEKIDQQTGRPYYEW